MSQTTIFPWTQRLLLKNGPICFILHKTPGINLIDNISSLLDTCPEWAWTCGNGNCIPGLALCDEIDQCGDNSDEENCTSKENLCNKSKYS